MGLTCEFIWSGGCGLLLFHCRPEKLDGKFQAAKQKKRRGLALISVTFPALLITAPDLAIARAPKRWEMVFVTCDDHSKQASRRLVPYDGVILDVVVTGLSDGATCAFLEHDVRLLAYPVLSVWLVAFTRYLLSPCGWHIVSLIGRRAL